MSQRTWRDRHGQLILRGRLESAKVSGFHSFEYAGGVIRLNTAAAAILDLCNGSRTCHEIVDCLSDHRRNEELACFAGEFLDAALRSGWILESDTGEHHYSDTAQLPARVPRQAHF